MVPAVADDAYLALCERHWDGLFMFNPEENYSFDMDFICEHMMTLTVTCNIDHQEVREMIADLRNGTPTLQWANRWTDYIMVNQGLLPLHDLFQLLRAVTIPPNLHFLTNAMETGVDLAGQDQLPLTPAFDCATAVASSASVSSGTFRGRDNDDLTGSSTKRARTDTTTSST